MHPSPVHAAWRVQNREPHSASVLSFAILFRLLHSSFFAVVVHACDVNTGKTNKQKKMNREKQA
jgi:hypothetical protein